MTEPAVLSPLLTYKPLRGLKYEVTDPGGFVIDTPIKPEEDVSTSGPNPWIRLTKEGRLFIRQGYMWDGASGPAIDTDDFMVPSLVHDAFYHLMRLALIAWKKFKDAVDRFMCNLCRDRGMWRIRSWWVYWGVRLFGKKACRPGTPDPYSQKQEKIVK